MDYFIRPFIIPPVCPFAARVFNVCYTTRLGKKTPFEVLYLYKPSCPLGLENKSRVTRHLRHNLSLNA